MPPATSARYIPGLTPPPASPAAPAATSAASRAQTASQPHALRPSVSKPGPSSTPVPPPAHHPEGQALEMNDDGFIEVRSRPRRRARVQENMSLPVRRSSPPPVRRAARPSVNVSRPPRVDSDFPAFRVPEQEGYATSYDAVATLEQYHPDLRMKNIVGRDGSSVLLPLDEGTYNKLDSLANDQAALVKILKLTPQTKTHKAIVMGYPIRMPVELLKRHPLVEEATRCVRTRFKWETRQVLLTLRGPPPPHIDLGNWGTFYLRPYTPEPLRCFRCQQFGHHQANCSRQPVCGVCSGLHPTVQCLDKYKANEEVRHKCPNCSGPHHAWNPICPARIRRVDQGREQQVEWVRDQQEKAVTPAPPGTFVWGQQRRPQASAAPPDTLNPADFPALSAVTLQAPPAQQPPVTPPPPPAPAQPQLPPGTLLLTEGLLRSFTTELTLAVAQVFQALTGVTTDQPKLEAAVSTIADNVVSKLVEKAQDFQTTLSPPTPLPRNITGKETEKKKKGGKETGTRAKKPAPAPPHVPETPPAQAESACASGTVRG